MALKQLVELGDQMRQVRHSCLGVDMRDLKARNSSRILLLERVVGIAKDRRGSKELTYEVPSLTFVELNARLQTLIGNIDEWAGPYNDTVAEAEAIACHLMDQLRAVNAAADTIAGICM